MYSNMNSQFCVLLGSRTSFQQSHRGYYTVTTYNAVQQCCSGYVGTPPDCQGNQI